MSGEKGPRYLGLSDEETIRETGKRLKAMKALLIEIRDALRSAAE